MLHNKSVENVMKSFLDFFDDEYVFVGFVKLSESGKVKEIDKKLVEKEKYLKIIEEAVTENKYSVFSLEGIKTQYPIINLLEV